MTEYSNYATKYVLYARKSTESEDKQTQSIADQLRVMKELAAELGINLVKTYTESKSAKKPYVREEFEKMMQGIEDGKYDGILAWDLSRLSRNPLDNGRLQQALDDGTITHVQTAHKSYHEDDDLLFAIESSMNSRFIKDHKKKVKLRMLRNF